MKEGYCFLCQRWRPLEKHHIFGGPNRLKSEKFGLTVDLCAGCHRISKYAVHRNADTMQKLHEYGQRLAMKKFGWTKVDFMRIFHVNYI